MSRYLPYISVLLIVAAFIAGMAVGSGRSANERANYYQNGAEAYAAALQVDTPPAGADEPERWAEALDRYRAVFDQYPDSEYADDAMFAVASRIDFRTQPDIANILYRRIINNYPDSEHAPEALNAVGVAHFELANYDRALVMFDQFLREYPTSPLREAVLLNRAVCQLKKGRYDDALDSLQILTEQFPDLAPAAQFYTGMVFFEKQEFPTARTFFENVLETADPEFTADAQFNIAQSYFSERMFEDALASYEETINGYPESGPAEESAFRIGWAYERLQQYDDAVDALKTAVESYPNSQNTPPAQVFMAKIYREGLKDLDAAVEAYRAIVDETIPLSGLDNAYDVRRNAQYQIGNIYETSGDIRAVEAYETMLQTFPEAHAAPDHPSNEIDETYLFDLKMKMSE